MVEAFCLYIDPSLTFLLARECLRLARATSSSTLGCRATDRRRPAIVVRCIRADWLLCSSLCFGEIGRNVTLVSLGDLCFLLCVVDGVIVDSSSSSDDAGGKVKPFTK